MNGLTKAAAALLRRWLKRGLTQAEVDAINAALRVTDESEAHRNISAAGLALIKRWEGLRLKAYRCPAGKWTIGYGSTGPHVRPGLTITEAEAESLLRRDLVRFETAINDAFPNLTQGQFDALVSLAFNTGAERVLQSTLAKRLREGDPVSAATEFSRWIYAGGQKLTGLVKRRADEAALFRGAA